MTDEYITLAQAIKFTRLSYSSLRSAIRSGRLKATKPMGGKIFISKPDLDAFMEGGKILPKVV